MNATHRHFFSLHELLIMAALAALGGVSSSLISNIRATVHAVVPSPIGMQFLAGLRMNDRHPGSVESPFYRENPKWQLGYGEGDYRGGMDYKYEGVRDAVLGFTEELLERYDLDGIELDWMRWCHMFIPCEAEENAPMLTHFMAKLRR